MKTLILALLALALVVPMHQARSAETRSLAQAVDAFNQLYGDHPVAKTQPPLTPEAVVAAIRWAMIDRTKLLVSDETFRRLGVITEKSDLPADFELELIDGYEPNEQVTFDVWSVRLRIPGGTLLNGSTCINIQEKMIRSRLIGAAERKVIHEWQEKERAQGGIGNMVRHQWMQDYYKARKAAAALDEKNQK